MKHCSHCGVDVIDDSEFCPLCFHALEEVPDPADWDPFITPNWDENSPVYTFPPVHTEPSKMDRAFRFLLLSSLLGLVVFNGLNRILLPHIHWGLVISGVLFYVTWFFFLFSRDIGYLKRVFGGFGGGALLLVLTDAALGFRGWSVSLGIPAAVILLDVTLAMMTMINRKRWTGYLIVELLMIPLGTVPLILALLGTVKFPAMSVAAFLVTVLVFLGTILIGGPSARAELRRRFHS